LGSVIIIIITIIIFFSMTVQPICWALADFSVYLIH
jgi:hypothetical protein